MGFSVLALMRFKPASYVTPPVTPAMGLLATTALAARISHPFPMDSAYAV